MSTTENYDVAVIGAGSAGFSAAITAAEQGARVALIGHGTIGGTCVNVGCVPSKTLIRAAEALYHARVAHRFNGIDATATISDWSSVIADKDKLVSDLRNAKYIEVLSSYDSVTYLEGKAELADGGVTVDGEFLQAEKTIITTGSHATIPPIEGIENVPYLTSTTALELDHAPVSMIVIGGGVIGCELGQMFSRLGTKVTILCRSQLLPTGEPEVSDALETALVAEGIGIKCGSVYQSISHDGEICLAYEQNGIESEVRAEQVLVATGRRANTDALGAEDVGVERLPNAGIKIDDQMRTTRPGVYAAGDVTGKDMFVYMAAYGAKIAVENALNSDSRQYDSTAMPDVVFTDPQVATVGYTEAEAKAAGLSVITSTIGLEHVPRALAARDTRGLIKLVADAKTRALLGAHIIAPEGADSIQTAVIAIKAGMTVDDLGSMIFPYLTTVEGLKLAAQTFDKDVSKLSCCAG